MNTIISEYYSDSKLKTAMVFSRGGEYRVVCLDSYLETEKEYYYKDLNSAEDFAEDWVLK